MVGPDADAGIGREPPDERAGNARAGARRLAIAGFWTGRFLLGVLLVLYGLSFVAPPPVGQQPIDYDDAPAAVAAEAVHNLRTETYRYGIQGAIRDADDTRPTLAAAFTIDNAARLYRGWKRTPDTGFGASAEPQRFYGTATVGYERYPASSSYVYAGVWHRDGGDRYSTGKNAFAAGLRFRDAPARVVAENTSWYVVRVDTGAIDGDVAYPGQFDPGADGAPNSLTLGIRKATDRIAWARYRAEADDGQLVATYEFDRGLELDVDRPLATYPPSTEVLSRLNLGIRALEALLVGGGGS